MHHNSLFIEFYLTCRHLSVMFLGERPKLEDFELDLPQAQSKLLSPSSHLAVGQEPEPWAELDLAKPQILLISSRGITLKCL